MVFTTLLALLLQGLFLLCIRKVGRWAKVRITNIGAEMNQRQFAPTTTSFDRLFQEALFICLVAVISGVGIAILTFVSVADTIFIYEFVELWLSGSTTAPEYNWLYTWIMLGFAGVAATLHWLSLVFPQEA